MLLYSKFKRYPVLYFRSLPNQWQIKNYAYYPKDFQEFLLVIVIFWVAPAVTWGPPCINSHDKSVTLPYIIPYTPGPTTACIASEMNQLVGPYLHPNLYIIITLNCIKNFIINFTTQRIEIQACHIMMITSDHFMTINNYYSTIMSQHVHSLQHSANIFMTVHVLLL